MDPDKLIYDLQELKPIAKKVYFYEREFINYGYRANPDMTLAKCTKTIVMCHCETGNIWSHLIAAIYFMFQLMLLLVRCAELYRIQSSGGGAGPMAVLGSTAGINLPEGAAWLLSRVFGDTAVSIAEYIANKFYSTIWSALASDRVNPYNQYSMYGSLFI